MTHGYRPTDVTPVKRVPADGVFSIDGLRYTMIKCGSGSAHVIMPDGSKSNISNEALCTVIDTELEDMLGVPMAATNKKPKKSETPSAVTGQTPIVPKAKRGGGKPALAGKRPANPETKRGKVLAMLLKNPSVAAIEKAFDMTRSAVLTYCFEIHRDHGWGYTIDGDKVNYVLPPDRKDMFAAAGTAPTRGRKAKPTDEDFSDML